MSPRRSHAGIREAAYVSSVADAGVPLVVRILPKGNAPDTGGITRAFRVAVATTNRHALSLTRRTKVRDEVIGRTAALADYRVPLEGGQTAADSSVSITHCVAVAISSALAMTVLAAGTRRTGTVALRGVPINADASILGIHWIRPHVHAVLRGGAPSAGGEAVIGTGHAMRPSVRTVDGRTVHLGQGSNERVQETAVNGVGILRGWAWSKCVRDGVQVGSTFLEAGVLL